MGPLGGLVVGERLGRVDTAEAGVLRHERRRHPDAEAESEHGAETRDLHLPEAGQRADPTAEIRGISSLRPDALGATLVLVCDDGAELLHAACHRPREAVDRGPFAERLLEPSRIHPCDRLRVEGSNPLLQLVRARERRLDRYLLVESEADQERERLAREQLVRLVGVGEVDRGGHGPMVDVLRAFSL